MEQLDYRVGDHKCTTISPPEELACLVIRNYQPRVNNFLNYLL